MNLNNTDARRKQILSRRQEQKRGTSFFRDPKENCQSETRRRASDGATEARKKLDFQKKNFSETHHIPKQLACVAVHSPRPSRVAVAYRALFFAGHFYCLSQHLHAQMQCQAIKKLRKKPKHAIPPPPVLGARMNSNTRQLLWDVVRLGKIFFLKIELFSCFGRAIACAPSRLALAVLLRVSKKACPPFLFLTPAKFLLAFGTGVVQIHTV